jgi:hypothetical protein
VGSSRFSSPVVAALVVAALAAISLLLAFAPVYDPWGWLVWGRELASLELDTGYGPSWKPLPVLITTLLSPAGEAAPELWLAIARAGWLASVVLAWRLAAILVFPDRIATGVAARVARRRVTRARVAAGALAALGLLLLHDPQTPWVRQFAGGLSEPLLVALVLGAVERQLSRRPQQALALAVAAALLRPEGWPLLALYLAYLWAQEPVLRRWLVLGGIAVPLLWLLPDLAGSGDALSGAERARGEAGADGLLPAIRAALELAPAALVVASVYAVVSARRDGERAIPVLALGALGWTAAVAALAVLGYAGLPRFAAPVGAIACVLGGVGLVRMLAAIDGARHSPRRTAAAAAVAALGLGLATQGVVRAAQVPEQINDAVAYARGVDELARLTGELGARAETCGPVLTSNFLYQTALAWQLERPLDGIGLIFTATPLRGTVLVEDVAPAAVRRRVAGEGRSLGSEGRWTAYAISCAGTASAAGGVAIAGVRGALR